MWHHTPVGPLLSPGSHNLVEFLDDKLVVDLRVLVEHFGLFDCATVDFGPTILLFVLVVNGFQLLGLFGRLAPLFVIFLVGAVGGGVVLAEVVESLGPTAIVTVTRRLLKKYRKFKLRV